MTSGILATESYHNGAVQANAVRQKVAQLQE